jgi:sigma-B regulation protein RsbU (phosphoserine phosphatase)
MDTGQVLTKVNQMLVDDLRTMFHVESSWFVTLLLVHIDLKSHTLAYASAGHVPGFLLNRSRHIDQVLNSTGVPLGLFAEARFGCSGFPLEPDHLLVLLTDGATEATNASGEPCGYQRLVDFALRNAAEPAGVIADRIYTTVRGFAGERTADDDLSIVVAKVQ